MYIVSVLSLLGFTYITLCNADCIWYGQCGYNGGMTKDKKLNCKYSGPPRPFSTQAGIDTFKELCPSLYTGPDVKTCCSDDQVLDLGQNMSMPRQILQRCPSCYHNFKNLWCYFTCGPKQAEYMSVNTTKPYVDPDNKTMDAIVSVEYVVSVGSAVGMFNSCRNVQYPITNRPVLSFLCEEDADDCTPQKWLDYMGTIQNGRAPFDIHFHISNKNMTFNGTVLKPLDINAVPCYKAVDNTTEACSCQDCPRNGSDISVQDTVVSLPCQYEINPNRCDDFLYPTENSPAGSSFRLEEVIVSRPNNHTVINYKNFNYTNIFDLTFLHQILDLQLAIANISAVSRNQSVTLQDFCLAPQSRNNTNCKVLSVLNYYQNSHDMLDKVAYDDYGWFVLANYLDHFEVCTFFPCEKDDNTELHTPCIGTFGGPIVPWKALYGYQNLTYRTATAFVITFLVHDYKNSTRRQQVKAWEKEFSAFMKTYKSSHQDMNITFSSRKASYGVDHSGWLHTETSSGHRTSSGVRPAGPKLLKPKMNGKITKNKATENFWIPH